MVRQLKKAMLKLEEIKVNSRVRGIAASRCRHDQARPDVRRTGARSDFRGCRRQARAHSSFSATRNQTSNWSSKHDPLSFSSDGYLFRLASEAQRLRLAFLFDPLIAVNTSTVDPLPHQITAVYETMLNRQPLRFLLADDPGAGKTIMTGLLVKGTDYPWRRGAVPHRRAGQSGRTVAG